MSETWIRVGFFVFVLAPIWATLLLILGEMITGKHQSLKVMISSLFGFVALQTFFWDLILLFVWVIAPMNNHQLFASLWFWMFGASGMVWWISSLAGYLLATLASVFSDDLSDTYVKKCFIFSGVSLVIYFGFLFLMYAANSLILSQ